MNAFLKRVLFSLILSTALLCSFTACGKSKKAEDAFGSASVSLTEGPSFFAPAEASLDDFTWAFKPKTYDSSKDVPFENPYGAGGIWEMAVWRYTGDKKSTAQRELYWINVALSGADGKLLDIDPEIYGFLAFEKSDEAKAGGYQGTDTAARLVEALAAGDGSVDARVIVMLAGIEDSSGTWTEKRGGAVELAGKYYPERMFLKAEDKKGNKFTANTFVMSGDEQHAVGSFTPAGGKPELFGVTYFCRKVK